MGMFLLLNGTILEGDIPSKGQELIKEFILHYQDKLITMWETQQFETLPSIE